MSKPEEFGIRGCYVLRNFLSAEEICTALSRAREIVQAAPLMRPSMPQGTPFKLTLTNAGKLGWWSDKEGYRYTDRHPGTGQSFPPIPREIVGIHCAALDACGLLGWEPDNLLINHYNVGESLGPHQDRTERDQSYPIVSVSLGADAYFAIGPGDKSAKRPKTILRSGDVVVMSGPARTAYHAVLEVLPTLPNVVKGGGRLNLTLRRAD